MIEIQSICSNCRTELNLSPVDVLVLLPDTWEPALEARLLHGCDQCGVVSTHAIGWRLAMLLEVNGVAALPDVQLDHAVEPHPENPPSGPVLTTDKLVELHRLLECEDWFDRLILSCPDG